MNEFDWTNWVFIPGLIFCSRVVDVSLEELEGNGDGFVSAGETAGITAHITVTRRPAEEMTLEVSSSTPFGEVLDPFRNLGTLPAGSDIVLSDPIRVRIASALPSDPYGVPLRMQLQWRDAPSRVVPVEIGVGTTVGREDDFDRNLSGWMVAPLRPTAFNEWSYGATCGAGGTGGVKCGLPRSGFHAGVDAALISPPILLPADAELLYDQMVDLVLPDSNRVLAGGFVEISVNGGDWQVATPDDGYPTGYGGRNPQRQGLPLFAGTLHGGAFHTERIDLSPYSGSVRIRFHFFSEVSSGKGLGWRIDNVRVRNAVTPVRVLFVETRVEGSDVRLSWRLAEPLPARVRWMRQDAGGAEESVVGTGWEIAAATGSLLDGGGAAHLPARYWLETVERDGSLDRWGPWTVGDVASEPPQLRVTENPWRNTVTLRWSGVSPGGETAVEIFDLHGRRIAELPVSSAAGSGTWNGQDGRGSPTPPGVYFARLRGVRAPTLRLVKLP